MEKNNKQPEKSDKKNLIDNTYMLTELLDMEKLEYFFNLFTE